MESTFTRVLKHAPRRGCVTEKRETLPPARPCGSWQGPSPLPRCQADPGPPGAKSPRPAPDPPVHPPPTGACFSWCGQHGSWRQRRARAGEPQCVSGSRPERGGRPHSEPPAPLHWQGPSPLPQRHADPWPAGGQSPRPAPAPPQGGRFAPAGSGACLYDFRRPCRLMALVRGAMAPARMRKARAGGSVSGFAVRQPMRPALFQHPVRGAAVRFGVRPDCHAFPCPIRKTFPPGWGSHYFFSAPGLGTSGWRPARRTAVQNLLTLSQ